ncbi:hypothetical protein AUK10_02645 [Candidatus Gracilibacteria bacterium CG2_30_37_12]|nr:MAG: hypothetical protein AUK10_02645 [Candidatus Gracilibacteria bacterium CG2_30_37_12]
MNKHNTRTKVIGTPIVPKTVATVSPCQNDSLVINIQGNQLSSENITIRSTGMVTKKPMNVNSLNPSTSVFVAARAKLIRFMIFPIPHPVTWIGKIQQYGSDSR